VVHVAYTYITSGSIYKDTYMIIELVVALIVTMVLLS
jgi:hypothetical protein